MENGTAQFTFVYAGASWEVTATYTRYSNIASADYDDEWDMKEIEAIGTDGDCAYGELQEVFVRKFASTEMESLAEVIDREALEKIQ